MKNESNDDEEANLAALLRAAGGRDAPPPGLAREVRAAVEAEWRAVVDERRRRRRRYASFAMAAGVGAVAIGAWLLVPRTAAPTAIVASVVRVEGRATADSAGTPGTVAPASVDAGRTLRSGDELDTGAGARVALAWSAGGTVRVDAGTRLELAADRVRLREGAVYVESDGAAGAPLVETPLGLVRHLGTRYEVRVQPGTLAVTVRDGRVAIGDAAASAVAGERVTLDAGGRVSREHVPAYGGAWDWVESVAPPFAIEGRTLDEYVAWAARERGLETRWASPAAREAARGVVLRGSIDGLPPADALAAVLATTRFRADVVDGALVVVPREDTAGALR